MVGPSPGDGPPATPVKVLVVDDHAIVAESLSLLVGRQPDMQCVGLAGTLAAARSLVVETRPDVLVLDHDLPDGTGVDALPELMRLRPEMQALVLTASVDDVLLGAAISAGAAGFVSKRRGIAEVIAAVRSVAAGEMVVSGDLLGRLVPRMAARRQAEEVLELTEREREILGMVAQGLSNAAIADKLVLSVYTVRNHISRLSSKLGAHSKLELLSKALSKGLVDPPTA